MMRECCIIRRAGIATTVQDLGRPGLAHLGVPRSGAADRRSAALANRLVGNAPDAALLETSGDLEVHVIRDCWMAVTGADARLSIDARAHDTGRSVFVARGGNVRLHSPTNGLRNYVAFDGGIVGNPVLGSLSTDTLSGIVPIVIESGVTLHSGPLRSEPVFIDPLPQRRSDSIDILPGPRATWCTTESMSRMITEDWVVAADVNRIGIRLDGPRMERAIHGEVPSEGLVRGAVQLLPTGSLIVMLADYPVTGGYPVVAVVADDGVDALVQCRPGERVRFRRSASAWRNGSSAH
jgi:biotin-dependent carboxylase-like uncharacterized protein